MAKRRRTPAQRRIARFAAYHWMAWSACWYFVGWKAGGPGGMFVGWAAATLLPYRTWYRWEERLAVRSTLKRMGVALR